jgi:hypothetical protein
MGVTATVPILPGAAVNQKRSYASQRGLTAATKVEPRLLEKILRNVRRSWGERLYPQSRRRGSSGTVVATRLSTSGLSRPAHQHRQPR